MSKTDFIYLRIWCDSFTFCQRGLFFLDSPCISHETMLSSQVMGVHIKLILAVYACMWCSHGGGVNV